MKDDLIGTWVRRFLLEHLVSERNLAYNTQRSYRDTLRLLLPFLAASAGRKIEVLRVEDLSAARVRAFLLQLEMERACGAATRNQRLAAIRSLSKFIALRDPSKLPCFQEIASISFKRAARPLIAYLEKDEMDALLAAPDRKTLQGRRDHALLLFMYNTGARADEVAHVCISDLHFGSTPSRDPSSVLIHGKGNKTRRCPLWASTVNELQYLAKGRETSEHVFLNRSGQPLTRFGIHSLVERNAATAVDGCPSLATKQVSPHTIRHTTATHLLRAGVDINTIRAWLGHVCLSTTNIYAEVDLEMKTKALANCEVVPDSTASPKTPWRADNSLMEFLRRL
jgi:integrase/recombinase XerD